MTEWLSASRDGIRKSSGFDEAMERASGVDPADTRECDGYPRLVSRQRDGFVEVVNADDVVVAVHETKAQASAFHRACLCGDPGDCSECQ